MEGRRNKKKRKKDRKEAGIQGQRRGKKKSSAAFKPVRLVPLVFQSVEPEGVVGRIHFTFLPS